MLLWSKTAAPGQCHALPGCAQHEEAPGCLQQLSARPFWLGALYFVCVALFLLSLSFHHFHRPLFLPLYVFIRIYIFLSRFLYFPHIFLSTTFVSFFSFLLILFFHSLSSLRVPSCCLSFSLLCFPSSTRCYMSVSLHSLSKL